MLGLIDSEPVSRRAPVVCEDDPSFAALALIEEGCALQRKVCSAVRQTFQAERRQFLLRSLARLKSAGRFRIGQSILNSALSLTSSIAGMGEQTDTRKGIKAGADALKEIKPLDWHAQSLEREAQRAQLEADEIAAAEADLKGWQDSVQDLERRMLDRLDAIQRAGQSERSQALGGR